MKKLTFQELKSQYEVIDFEKLKEIIGGDGVIKSGSGTAQDPYVISTAIYVDNNSFTSSNSYQALTAGINQFSNNGDSFQAGGKHYKISVEVNSVANYNDFHQKTVVEMQNSYYEDGYKEAYGTYVGGGVGNPSDNVLGTTTNGNKVEIYDYKMTGLNDSGYVLQQTVMHELAHTFGLDDNYGSTGDWTSMSQFTFDASGNITGGPIAPTSSDYADMINSDKIHWADGVQH